MAVLTTRNQRVLVVADVSAEHIHGGAERMLHHHVRALLAAGMQVTIVTRQASPEQALCMTLPSGVQEYRLPFQDDRGWKGLLALKRAAQAWWAEHHDFDVVVAEQPFTMWALMQAGCRLPRVQVCHSFAFEEYATRYGLDWNWKHRVTVAAMRWLEGKVYRSASSALVLSDFMRQRLEDFFAVPFSSIAVAAGGIEPHAVQESRQALRQRLWADEADVPHIVTVRNMVPRTGVDMMIQAAAIVHVDRPDVRWHIMGTGEFLDAFQGLSATLGMQDVIAFQGYVDDTKMYQTLSAADAFMLPTRALEGFGLVTLEANAQGLPVIATPVGANPDVVGWHPLNIVADVATPDALAQSVFHLLEALPDEPAKSALAQDTAEHFAWHKHDAALVHAVNELTLS